MPRVEIEDGDSAAEIHAKEVQNDKIDEVNKHLTATSEPAANGVASEQEGLYIDPVTKAAVDAPNPYDNDFSAKKAAGQEEIRGALDKDIKQ